MTKRTLTKLAAIAVLIAVGIAVSLQVARKSPVPRTPTVEQDADAKPPTNEAPLASEQIPQYNKGGFVPPPSDATESLASGKRRAEELMRASGAVQRLLAMLHWS